MNFDQIRAQLYRFLLRLSTPQTLVLSIARRLLYENHLLGSLSFTKKYLQNPLSFTKKYPSFTKKYPYFFVKQPVFGHFFAKNSIFL